LLNANDALSMSAVAFKENMNDCSAFQNDAPLHSSRFTNVICMLFAEMEALSWPNCCHLVESIFSSFAIRILNSIFSH